MTLEEYNGFCESLAHTTHIVQWGGSHVWKIGGKVFAIANDRADDGFRVSFKVSELGFDILKEQPGCQGAPHLASRGMKWIQRYSDESMSDNALKDYLCESYRLVSLGLTKKLQKELGLNQ
ncbi:MAG: MmcQ/YjbR family DNA-binding protein [Henriciella sp.]|uniref:MmcQ/YjbR family DNA-binding protein n=1 Tax=Henriciella sp. TaxID=1968823 RepID=UPI003C793C82